MLLFTADTVGELLSERLRKPQLETSHTVARLTGVCRALADLHEGNQSDAAVNRAASWLAHRVDWPTSRLLDYMLGLIVPRIGVEKSPDTLYCGDGLTACIEGFPNARFIHLTRHPTDSVISLRKHSGAPPRPTESLAEWCADIWYSGHLRIARFLSCLPESQWLRLRGEDLIREPVMWLPRILRWLDLEVTDDLIRRMLMTECWRFANRGESGLLFGADPTFLNSPRLQSVPEPGPIWFDPRWQLSGQTIYRISALAGNLGYLSGMLPVAPETFQETH